MASSKRQTTFAKMQREQRVKEKRALKKEKKQAAREAKAAGIAFPPTDEDVEAVADEEGSDEMAPEETAAVEPRAD